MTEPPGLAQLHKTLAALAAEVERQSRQLAEQRTAAERAQESADQAHRVLVDIVDRVQALADKVAPTTGSGGQVAPQAGAPMSWLTIKDTDTARVALADLADWLQRIYVHYPGAVESLGECWLWHPAAVEELMALRAAWLVAYTGPDASAARAVDWHDRALPGVQRRIRAALGDCSIAAHRRGGRADQLRPAVPAAAAADQLAAWWTTTHGTTGAPTPSPDLEADLTGTR